MTEKEIIKLIDDEIKEYKKAHSYYIENEDLYFAFINRCMGSSLEKLKQKIKEKQ